MAIALAQSQFQIIWKALLNIHVAECSIFLLCIFINAQSEFDISTGNDGNVGNALKATVQNILQMNRFITEW